MTPTDDRFTFAYGELRRLLETQVSAIQATDDRASSLAQFNALVVGVVVTGASALGGTTRPSGGMGLLMISLLVAGVVSLAVSTIQVALALLNREISIGLDAGDLADVATSTAQDPEIRSAAIIGYRDCVEHNFLMMAGSAKRIQMGLYALCVGIVCLAAAAVTLSFEVIL